MTDGRETKELSHAAGERTPTGAMERALAILQTFKFDREKSIMDIAADLGLSRSTAYRLADRLRELGFLEIDPKTSQWRLGREVIQLGVAALQSTELMQVAPGFLRYLMETTRESVNLAVFDADRMMLVFREQGPQSLTVSSRLGSHRPMHASGLGKAYLSGMEDSERRLLISRLDFKRYAPATLMSAAELERDIVQIRARGYAIDDREFEASLACCAAPVFDHRGVAVGAISASGLAERIMPQVEGIGVQVTNTARAISQRLGHISR